MGKKFEVGFETFSGGSWKMLALKDPNNYYWKAITVGAQDLVLRGTKKEIVKWLGHFQGKVQCSEGYGREVWIILRGLQPKLSEVLAKEFVRAFGIDGGVASLLFTGAGIFTTAPDQIFAITGSVGEALEVEDHIKGKLDGIIEEFIRGGKRVEVRISCSKGAYKASDLVKDSVIKLPSGLSSKYTAGAVASLEWD